MAMQASDNSETQVKSRHSRITTRGSSNTLNIHSLTDSELLVSIAINRNKLAFQEFYTRHERHFFNLGLRILQNPDLAAEATQEAMLKIWRSAASYKTTGNAKGWITKVFTNECLIQLRTRGRKKEISREDGMTWVANRNLHPGEVLETNDLQTALRVGLQSLPPTDQRLITLYFESGLSQDDIAKCMHIPQSTISQLIKKILSKLRADLTQAGFGATMISSLLNDPAFLTHWLQMCPTPATLQDSIFTRITSESAASKKVASGISLTHLYWQIALGVTVLLSASLFFIDFNPPSNVSVRRKTTSINPSLTSKSTPTLFKKVFHFNQPGDLGNSIVLLKGTATFRKQDGFESKGCLATGKGLSVFKINLPDLRLPVKLTVRHQVQPHIMTAGTQSHGMGGHLKPELNRTYFGHFNYRHTDYYDEGKLAAPGYWKKFELYFQKNGNVAGNHTEFYSVILHETTNKPQIFLQATEYILFDELVIEELPIEKAIDLSEFIAVRNKFKREDYVKQNIQIHELTNYSKIDDPIAMRFIPPLK